MLMVRVVEEEQVESLCCTLEALLEIALVEVEDCTVVVTLYIGQR